MQTEIIPNEQLGIKGIWLQQIRLCAELFSKRSAPDGSVNAQEAHVGCRLAVDATNTLYQLLVDYGEAHVATLVAEYYDKVYLSEVDAIWLVKNRTTADAYTRHARVSLRLFHHILEVLNQFQMLFPESPAGYSNCIMESIAPLKRTGGE